MNILLSYILGTLLLVYGAVKITFAVLAFTLNDKAKARVAGIPVVGWILNTDNTLSGRLLDVVLAVFGVFSILHSLHLFRLKHLPNLIHKMVESEEINYDVHLIIGTILFFYYVLVAYFDTGIPREESELLMYKIGGVAGGLSFYLAVPIMYLYNTYSKKEVRRSIVRLFTVHRIKATLSAFFIGVLLLAIAGVLIEALVNTPASKGHVPAFSVFLANHLAYL